MAVRASAAEAIERARAEKQREQEAMQLEAAKLARSRLIRMVMHDLRSPLLSVLNTTATLMELHPSTPLRDADVLQGFEVLNTCTTLMENIVSDMLGNRRRAAPRRARLRACAPARLRAPARAHRARRLIFPRAVAAGAGLADSRTRARGSAHAHALALAPASPPLLDFERIDAGRLLLAKAPFLVTQLLDDARRTFGGLAEVKGIALESDVDPRLRELLLLGDARRLQQCLNNGISNALKFSERGTRVTIRALYAEVESPSRSRRDGALRSSKADADAPSSEASAVGVGGARVRVLVQDEGVGIDESELAVLNEGVAFAQVGAGQLQGKGGSGLGLLITRQLLALHSDDSRLRISSDGPGKGMTFELDMQLERACMPALSEGLLRAAIAEAHAAPPAAAAVASHPSAATSSCASPQTTVRSAAASDAGATPASPGPLWLPAGFRCLYVDDDAELCRTLPQRLFGPSAIAFDIARDGAEAVRLALGDDKGKYGLILMDHKMPRLSGALATRALRTGGYAGKLVGMMADDGLDLRCPERDEFVAAGLNACVEKRGELESYVRTMLRDMSDDLAAGGLGVAPDHASLDDAQSNHSGSGRFVRRFDAAVAVARRMSKPAARSPSWLEENRPSEPRADRPRDGSAYTSEGEEAPLFESRPAPLPGARRQRASSLMSAYLGAPPLSPLRRRSQPLAMPAGFRALHVDDDKTLQRSTVLRLFKPLNVPHDLAQNGREALDRILGAEGAPGAPYDLVMLDNQMPVMGGTQAARALRAAGFKGVIVGLTGDPHGCVERDEFDASGVDLTLDKGSSAIALLLAMLRDLAVRGLFDSRAQPVVVMREFLCTHAVKYADTARVVASSGAGGANPNLSNVPIR
jgi:signal transduction histidine kinase/DNA-binding response OmpR family regulator